MPAGPPDSPFTSRTLSLRTLGEAGLYAVGAAEPVLGPGKPYALLVYLALTPGRRTSRDFLLDLLWADLDPDRARNALRQTLFHLRRLIGDDALTGTEELTLTGAIGTDRDQFVALLEQGDPEGAIGIYRGAFLPAFGVPGGAAFEQWADLERHRLEIALLRSADIVVRRHLNQGDARGGLRIAQQVRTLAPTSEAAWRLVLEAVISAHDLVGAAVEADALQRWAEAEELVLEAATRSAMARARGLAPTRTDESSAAGLVAELTGREREFSAITSAWDAARVGRARHLHLAAAAGIGKSRLLHDACARLRASGARIVQVRGTIGDRDVPYALAGDLASAIAALRGATGIAPASASTLVALNPTLSAQFAASPDHARGEEALRRRIHAVAELIHAVSSEEPFVLAIDDLHWIDAQSWRLLEGVFNRIDGAHLLCITAARPERRPTNSHCVTLPLAALTLEQVASLVSALGSLPSQGGWSGTFNSGLHRATGGSPLLLLETIRLAIEQGVLALENAMWHCRDEARLHALLQTGEALRERVRALAPEELWLLGVLATAGAPIEPTLPDIPRDQLDHALARLEQQGLVTRNINAWIVAHDEIVIAVRAALSPALQAGAERAVGELYVQGNTDDPDRLLRAVRHFAAAHDHRSVQQLHRRYVLRARRGGDRRSDLDMTVELLGEPAESVAVRSLVRALPVHWRIGLWSGARQLAAAFAVVLVPLAVMLGGRDDAKTAQRLVYVDTTGKTLAVGARQADWNGTSAPAAPSSWRSTMSDAARAYPELPPAISPDGRSVAWIQDSGDSTTLDIWLRTPSGVRRLTRQWRDDLVQGWLPDGSALIGTTERWSPVGASHYEIAIFDTATGTARQLTHSTAQNISPYVSPDGTRVAFLRNPADAPPMVCVTTIDGAHEPECRTIGGQPIFGVFGWVGLDRLLITVDLPDSLPLVIYDWARNTSDVIVPYASGVRESQDLRWVAASARMTGTPGFHEMIIPLDNPAKAREVSSDGLRRNAIRWWEGSPDQSWLIDHLEFTDSVREIQPGIGTRLGVRAMTRSGTQIPIHAPIAWSSSDTLVATIDSVGEIRVHSAGTVKMTASLVGWRTVSKSVRVAGKTPEIVFNERWDENWTSRWLPWGDPTPVVVTGPQNVRALWNRGDGSYPSMAVLRDSLSITDGLGLEIQVSTPIGMTPHQRFDVAIVGGIDLASFAAADQRKAPPTRGEIELSCGIIFPGQSRWEAARAAFRGGVRAYGDLSAIAATLRSGTWWTLRLQILPDGRCGVAINNRVVWLSTEPILRDRRYRIWLGDESAGTKLLHGPMQVWTGVRTDIDWTVRY